MTVTPNGGEAQNVYIVGSDGTSGGAGTASADNQTTEIAALTYIAGDLDLIDSNTSGLNAKFGSLGQKTMAGSTPVVIASDNGLALDATLTGGALVAIVKGGAKGATTAGIITAHSVSADITGCDVVEGFKGVYEDNSNGVAAIIYKPLAVNTYAPTLATNFGAATKANIKASAGNILSIRVSNTNAAARFFQLHNKATAPVATEVPLYSFLVPAGSASTLGTDFFCGSGGFFSTGISFAWSTTAGTFTDSATAGECNTNIHYV